MKDGHGIIPPMVIHDIGFTVVVIAVTKQFALIWWDMWWVHIRLPLQRFLQKCQYYEPRLINVPTASTRPKIQGTLSVTGRFTMRNLHTSVRGALSRWKVKSN